MDRQPKTPSLKRLMIWGAVSYVVVMGLVFWTDYGFWGALTAWFCFNLGLFIFPYMIQNGQMR